MSLQGAGEYLGAKIESANNNRKKQGKCKKCSWQWKFNELGPILWKYCHHGMSSGWEKLDSVRLNMILYICD
jgi:hypothetical protein